MVTGAGRGIGRAYAQLLGARGASVVVNDLGGSKEGLGADAGPARSVADEIVAAGGVAVGDTNDVSTEAGARRSSTPRVREFGRVDIVVNNAGIVRWGDLPDVDLDGAAEHPRRAPRRVVQRHPGRVAALVEQQYGRVVMTTSTGCSACAATSRTPRRRPAWSA